MSAEDLIGQAQEARREGREADAERLASQAVAEARASGSRVSLIGSLKMLAQMERDTGRLDAAGASYQEAVMLCRAEGDALLLAHTIRHLGDIHWDMGRADLAEPCLDEALALYRSYAAKAGDFANALRPMAILKEAAGDRAAARALWREARDAYTAANIDAGAQECARRLALLP